MFDLTKAHHHHQLTSSASPGPVLSGCPEVTGVSPREGPTNSQTRLTIRGSNLGQSATDVVSLVVAGVDCTSSLEYESSSRLSCVVIGPHGPAIGDVIVETRSGGVGISMVQFRFVEDTGTEEDQQFGVAVPYDAGESRQTPLTSSVMRMTSAPAVAATG